MGINVNSGLTTAHITGSVSVGASLPAGATQVCEYNTVNNSTATVYTVTAGKTLYITNATIVVSTSASAAGVTTLLEADILGTGSYKKLYFGNLAATTSSINQNFAVSIDYAIPIQVPASKLVRITAGTGATVNATISGYEM